MVMRSVARCTQGSTLIEMLVASTLGVIVIGTIGSVFVTNQRLSSEKSLELLLSQNLFSATQMMKEEIWRAGYDSDSGQSVKLSGALSIPFNPVLVNLIWDSSITKIVFRLPIGILFTNLRTISLTTAKKSLPTYSIST